jgi:hypothetical protein
MKKLVALITTLILLGNMVMGQSGGTFNIEKSVIAGGGGDSSGGTFQMSGTIGQSLAGTTSGGGTFTLASGFWTTAPNTIFGTITYGNVLSGPARFISNVQINGVGSVAVMSVTGPPGATAGQYALSGFGSGGYTVTPTKTGGVNGSISSFDAGLIALHVAGPPNPQLNPNQLSVADVSGNGSVTSFDAGSIAKFVAGPPYSAPGIGATATWRFTPANKTYASINSNLTGEDYVGRLMGEVSGNWTNTGARPALDGAPESAISLSLPELTASSGSEIVVPVKADNIAGKRVISYEFDVRYDPAVLQPASRSAETAGTLSGALNVVTNSSQPGLLRVVVYGAKAIDRDGVLIDLRFEAIGTSHAASPIVLENVIINDGLPVYVTNGRVGSSGASDQ